jgi:hypothetical protein
MKIDARRNLVGILLTQKNGGNQPFQAKKIA